MPNKNIEDQFQIWACTDYLPFHIKPGIVFFHVPNEFPAPKDKLNAKNARIKRMKKGVMPGVHDILFFRRHQPLGIHGVPVAHAEFIGSIELKTGDNTMSEAQIEFARKVEALGGKSLCVWNPTQFKEACRELGVTK